MKVYVSCHHPDAANEAADALVAAGHEVVSTWHRELGPRPERGDAPAWAAKVASNFRQIAAADVLVLVAGADRYPGGKFMEAQRAIDQGKKVVTLRGVENGYLHQPGVRHAADLPSMMSLLS